MGGRCIYLAVLLFHKIHHRPLFFCCLVSLPETYTRSLTLALPSTHTPLSLSLLKGQRSHLTLQDPNIITCVFWTITERTIVLLCRLNQLFKWHHVSCADRYTHCFPAAWSLCVCSAVSRCLADPTPVSQRVYVSGSETRQQKNRGL